MEMQYTLICATVGGPVTPPYASPYTTKWGAAGVARANMSRAWWSSPSYMVALNSGTEAALVAKARPSVIDVSQVSIVG